MAEITHDPRRAGNMQQARCDLVDILGSVDWDGLLELARDEAMHQASSQGLQGDPRREVLYYLSKAMEGAMGLAKGLRR